MFHSLRFRLLVTVILIIVAALGLMTFFGLFATSQMFERYQAFNSQLSGCDLFSLLIYPVSSEIDFSRPFLSLRAE